MRCYPHPDPQPERVCVRIPLNADPQFDSAAWRARGEGRRATIEVESKSSSQGEADERIPVVGAGCVAAGLGGAR